MFIHPLHINSHILISDHFFMSLHSELRSTKFKTVAKGLAWATSHRRTEKTTCASVYTLYNVYAVNLGGVFGALARYHQCIGGA